MRKRILVTGANGQLGQSIAKLVSANKDLDFTFVTQKELEFDPLENIDVFFQGKVFDVVVNCAAYTAVDKAETEYELANLVNHLAVKRIAEICKTKDINLIHISTDYVFNGRNFQPYIEADATDPLNVYGKTKLAGEQVLQEINPKGIIIRTSWVYSEFDKNFVNTMLRLGKEKNQINIVSDQVGTPTYARDLAEAILNVIQHSKFEDQTVISNIYHYSNEGVASWYDFTKAIFEFEQINCNVLPIETKKYLTPAKRPLYSLMSKIKIKDIFDIEIPYWKDALERCLKQRKD
ncbi:MAG: dTDP-4-dehydrorhamnose reductase [endosymbiont of Galathealinum brachiosum]|uniref:dTDP-4-dehydrorhamnose reductase n=1 Tax=endosymbiont of Galathealinum brachiosum TaxID=2200906 RepID=A0A370DA22_9GAMM|nr:MAG: dTDP-4-dehydrorhamnose reductase [endosymbiont of Galathealinum brachiosum]